MLRRMSSEPAVLPALGKDKFLDKELRPVCLKGVDDPLRASRMESMLKSSPVLLLDSDNCSFSYTGSGP